MRDISARELKGHNILAVERFQDNTRWMIEFSVQRPSFYGSPGDEMRLFLSEDGYQAALLSQQRREIKIKRYENKEFVYRFGFVSLACRRGAGPSRKGDEGFPQQGGNYRHDVDPLAV